MDTNSREGERPREPRYRSESVSSQGSRGRSPSRKASLRGALSLCHALLCLAVSSAVSQAATIARWDAGAPTQAEGIQLQETTNSDWHCEKVGAWKVARLKPSTNYYSRAAYRFSMAAAPTQKVWLVLEYLDRGYGLISVSPGVAQRKQCGLARVNSGRLRRAVLEYGPGQLPKTFSVYGLDYLRSVTVEDQEPKLEQTPLVEPAVKFTVPSQRVTTAGMDSANPDSLPEALAGMRNQLPLLRAIGFNAVESYIRWGLAEREPGVYDWSYYDALLAEIERHGLQWFPMLLAGSGYAIPAWLYESTNNVGFKCLEHGITHDTQSIFYPYQAEYAHRFIEEFGKHYGGRSSLLGIRLGPSGDFGEAQYPAKGPGTSFAKATPISDTGRLMLTLKLTSGLILGRSMRRSTA